MFEPWMKLPVEMKRYPWKTSTGRFVDPVKINVFWAMMLQQKMASGCAARCAGVLKRMTASAPWLLPNLDSDAGLSGFQTRMWKCKKIDKHAHKQSLARAVHPSVSQSAHARTCCGLNLPPSERTCFFLKQRLHVIQEDINFLGQKSMLDSWTALGRSCAAWTSSSFRRYND